MKNRKERFDGEQKAVEDYDARKARFLLRSSQCKERTSREEARMKSQQKSTTLVNILDRHQDDLQRVTDFQEKSQDNENFKNDQKYLASAEESFEQEQEYHEITHDEWKAQSNNPALSKVLEWVLITRSSTGESSISSASQGSTKLGEAWKQLRMLTTNEKTLLEQEKSCLDDIEDGWDAETDRITNVTELHEEEQFRVDQEMKDFEKEFE